MEQNHKEKRARNYVPLYLSIVLVLGILIGAYLIPVQVKTITSSSTMSTKIGEVMQLINRYYFDKVDVDELNDQTIR